MTAASAPSVNAVPHQIAALAGLSAFAASGHIVAAATHLRQDAISAVAFAVVGVAQMAWALRTARHHEPRLLLAGVIGNMAVITAWVVSRTAGLPLGAHAGVPEPAALLDSLVTLAEALLVAGAVAMLARSTRRIGAWLPVVLVAAAMALMPLAALGEAAHAGTERPRPPAQDAGADTRVVETPDPHRQTPHGHD